VVHRLIPAKNKWDEGVGARFVTGIGFRKVSGEQGFLLPQFLPVNQETNYQRQKRPARPVMMAVPRIMRRMPV